jgi:hypothetical protein
MQFGEYPPNENQTTNLKDALETSFEDNIKHKDNVLFLIITDGEPDGNKEKISQLIYKHLSKKDDYIYQHLPEEAIFE